jgi:esterase FrsA
MADIVSNAFGFDRQPSAEETAERGAQMSLRPLLDRDTNSPMIVVNGPTTSMFPKRTRLSSEGAATRGWSCSRTPDTVPSPSSAT